MDLRWAEHTNAMRRKTIIPITGIRILTAISSRVEDAVLRSFVDKK
jgi:hypothetical protein